MCVRIGQDGLTDTNSHRGGGFHTTVLLTALMGKPSTLPDRWFRVPTAWTPSGSNRSGSISGPCSTTKLQLFAGDAGNSTMVSKEATPNPRSRPPCSETVVAHPEFGARV